MYQTVIDQIVCKLYNQFYKKHKTLFEKDPAEYWRQASQYKSEKLRIELAKPKYQRIRD